ncbi:TVP38/TMEM64 family protein [Neomoorella thermoacetica]|uniref:TVP38/TMEM64 family protein n=1 Tax=Neomoorella thermoacetica TaxID=1525 RepID=UPI0030CC8B29
MDKKTRWLIKLGIPLVLIGAYFLITPLQQLVKRLFFLFAMVDVSAIKAYILSFGILAPVVSFLLMVFQSVIAPLPAFLITFANAALFGWVKGAILSWSSAMVGAMLCFYIARFYGREVVEMLTSKLALESVDEFFQKYGQYAVLIARLLPFISFDVVSYAAGLTSMGFWQFLWATGLGQLPATLVYSYAGDLLAGSVRNIVSGLLLLFAAGVLAVLFKRIFKEKRERAV